MKKDKYFSIGVMSGTSFDGIDISFIESDGKTSFKPIFSKYYKYTNALRIRLKLLSDNYTKSNKNNNEIISINDLITNEYIKSIQNFLKEIKNFNVDIISLHGQTIFHDPSRKSSIQLCNAEKINKHFMINIVYDFRQNDIKNNGEGAPLTPVFHKLINSNMRLKGVNVFLNVGGVSNVTVIKDNNIITAFDTGPGMGLLDNFIYEKKNIQFDRNGNFSSQGKVIKKIVRKLMKDPYFTETPPKSLDKNKFNIKILHKYNFYDSCATIVDFSTECIKSSLSSLKINVDNLIVMGGGTKNKYFMSSLKDKLNVNILNINEFGMNEDFIESQAFAYLGIRRLKNLPITFPQTTGTKKPITAGKIIYY